MTEHETDAEMLGGYLLGALVAGDREQVELHLAACERCRAEVEGAGAMSGILEDLPDEALLEGPPDDGDLLLARTMRQVRAEAAGAERRSRAWRGVATAAAVTVAVAAGVAVGRGTGNGEPPVALPATTRPAPPVSAAEPPLVGSAVDPVTGVRMTVSATPTGGWVRVSAAVVGVPPGERCRLTVVARDGRREVAGSWLSSEKGGVEGTALEGSSLLTDVAAVEVVNDDGRRFVSVPV